MARVFIPVAIRSMTGGLEAVEAEGSSVRAVIQSVDTRYPGIEQWLCEGGELRTGLSVVVDGSISVMGLLEKVQANSEVHFLPAIGGG